MRPAIPLLAVLLLPVVAQAGGLQTRNEAALSRFAALPLTGTPALAAEGPEQWQFTTDLTSEFYAEDLGRESVRLDGETLRLGIDVRGRWSASVDWGLRLNLLDTGGGFLDRFIEDWHDIFSLPNGGREQFAQDQYRYQLVQDGVTVLDTDRTARGLGDLEARVGFALRPGQVLRLMLKLPTGDDARLTGGHLGAALWLDSALPFADGSAWGGHYSVGGSLQQTRGALADRQQPAAGFASLGLQRHLIGPLSALGQLYAHTPLYRNVDSDIGDPGLQLSLGGRWAFNDRWQADLAFQEDLIVNASPDFSLHFALRYHGSR